jgi:hypothetical protein
VKLDGLQIFYYLFTTNVAGWPGGGPVDFLPEFLWVLVALGEIPLLFAPIAPYKFKSSFLRKFNLVIVVLSTISLLITPVPAMSIFRQVSDPFYSPAACPDLSLRMVGYFALLLAFVLLLAASVLGIREKTDETPHLE